MKNNGLLKIFIPVIPLIISAIVVVILMTKCEDKETIYGKWFASSGGEIEVVVFEKDNRYYKIDEEYAFDKDYYDFKSYKYDEGKKLIIFPNDEESANVILKDNYMQLDYIEYDYTIKLYRNRDKALKSDAYYYTTDEFISKLRNENGFCIKDGVLYAYIGEEQEVTVPSNVEVIYHEAFAGDYNRGVNLKKITVPGNVKKIMKNAFSFTSADKIFIQEGVEIIEEYAFMDAYIDEIRFPSSLKNIGTAILETEEGLDNAKIYVKKGSYAEKYFKENMPYGKVELIIE